MLRLRPLLLSDSPGGVADLFAVGQLIDDAMQPGHFFVAPELRLSWIAARSETIPWEIFRGRSVDASQTRLQKTFLSWHVIEENEAPSATEPTISVKLDVHAQQIHVTRGLLAYVWEGYDTGGGVIESRETVKWTRELVGTIRLEEFADLDGVREELTCLIWQAIVGTSRLPLTSVEAPLPAFSFGQLHYVYRNNAAESPITRCEDLPIDGGPALTVETVKLLEFILRQARIDDAFRFFEMLAGTKSALVQSKRRWRSLWRELFNSVSLSPQTCLMHNALICTGVALSIEEMIDFDGELLRQLARHLTAFDLVAFHHRGANYPDALLLDALLKRHAETCETDGDFFVGPDLSPRMRRRALRQACLLRRHYEGHAVPDLPTSPGENARVMPASHPRVPEEQLLQSQHRRRRLFADEPLAALLSLPAISVLAQSVADLEHLDERVELGLGLFIDRPLGYAKQIGEPDLTPMLAHEAFSPALARRRWGELKMLCAELGIAFDASQVDALFEHGPWPAGLPHAEVAECPRPTVALCDVRKVADDFVILRTKPVGLAQMLGHFDLVSGLRGKCRLDFLHEAQPPRLCVQGIDDDKQPALLLYDAQLRKRVEMHVDASQGYVTRGGVELPRAGLCVVAVWEDTDDPAVLRRREANLR